MIKVDIVSGFLGAGKTTLINKLVTDIYAKEKTVLIENEFGEIGIDGAFIKDSGIQVNELNSGCICCSLVGDFEESLKKVIADYRPTRIVIEPSGVGKLSDIISAIKSLHSDELVLNNIFTVVDGTKIKIYAKNFGEFYNNQIKYAKTILISRSQNLDEAQLTKVVAELRATNPDAPIITTPWDQLTAQAIDNAEKSAKNLEEQAIVEAKEHSHHHDHGDHCHHHDHHHDHDEHCHHHDHHHDHGEHCHHHDGDEVFESVGIETVKKYSHDQLAAILKQLATREDQKILRVKGIVASKTDNWWHFDLVPGEYEIREGQADINGKICIIGSELNREELESLFLS